MTSPKHVNAAYYFVDENANRSPERAAIYYEDLKITYRDLQTDINRFGNALKGLGIKQGDRFVCRMPNVPEAAVVLLAGMKIGAVPVPSFHFLRKKEVRYIVDVTNSMGIVSHSAALDEIRDVKTFSESVRWIISVGEHEAADYTFENLLKTGSLALQPADTKKDDLAVLCFTSGATGNPKGLPHKHESLLLAADAAVPLGLDGLKGGDVVFTTSPFGFSFGLCGLVYYPFRFGAAAVYSEKRMEAEDVFEILQRHRVTHFLTVPTMCQKMLSVPDAKERYDISCLRVLKVGAMPTPLELQREWRATFGIDILPGFGMQELIGSAISCFPKNFKYGSIGLPQPGCEVRVIDDNNQDVPEGKEGRLAIKTPFTIPYYWKDPETTKKYLTEDGWLYTDDVVYQDEEGFFYYVGRAGDVIISSGWTISPAEIEDVLKLHPSLSDVAVFDIPDPEKGRVPVAAVVLEKGVKGSQKLTKELEEFVKNKLAPYKTPREVYYVESLPKTATGKVLRHQLREEAPKLQKQIQKS